MPLARVLIVDDEHTIAETLAEIISSSGYEATVAYSGEEAARKAAVGCPDILLTDVLMPGMNGFELALKVKRSCPRCRLLLFSGQAATALLAQQFADTFTRLEYRFELLPKPLHPTALLKKLEQILIQAV
jgi:CheY-like chemotaxis protein